MTVWTDPAAINPSSAIHGWTIFNQSTMSSLLNGSSNLALSTGVSSAATLALLASQGTSLVSNGGFEAGSQVTGWSAQGTAASISDAPAASEGARVLRLGSANSSGSIAQDIKTEENTSYTLVFTVASTSAAVQGLRVNLESVSDATSTLIEGKTFQVAGAEKKTYTFTFQALSNLTRLQLVANGGAGPLSIDNVRLIQSGASDFNLLENGDFEDGPAGSGNADGWTIETAAGVELFGAGRAMSSGRFLALGGWSNGGGAVSQTFNTSAGTVYSLTFGVQAYQVDQSLSLSVLAKRNGGTTLIMSDSSVVHGGFRQSYTFTAQSSQTTLRFAVAGSAGDLHLDDVRVVEVAGVDNKLENGDLETPFDAEDDTYNNGVAGWTLDDGSQVILDTTRAASDTGFISLGALGNGAGTASQNISTRPGSIYTFTFSANAYQASQSMSVNVQSLDEDQAVATSLFTKVIAVAAGGYKTYSVTFTATSDVTVLTIGTAAGAGDLLIDDVAVARVAGKQDVFSDAAENLEEDLYIAGSPQRLSAAIAELGAGFADPAQRRWWATERYDSGTDTNERLFDAKTYFAQNPDVDAKWTGTAIEHFLAYDMKEGRKAPSASKEAISLATDDYIAASPSIIAEAKKALGSKFADGAQRGAWARAWFDAHPSVDGKVELFDEDTYLAMHPEMPADWQDRPLEYFLFLDKTGLAPLMSMGASAIEPDEYLAGSPDLIASARAELKGNFSVDELRQAWTLRYFVQQGYSENRDIFDSVEFMLANLTDDLGDRSVAANFLLSDAAGKVAVGKSALSDQPPPHYDRNSYWDKIIGTSRTGFFITAGFKNLIDKYEARQKYGKYESLWVRQFIDEFIDGLRNDYIYNNIVYLYGKSKSLDTLRDASLKAVDGKVKPSYYKDHLDADMDAAVKGIMYIIVDACPTILRAPNTIVAAINKYEKNFILESRFNLILEPFIQYSDKYRDAWVLLTERQNATVLTQSLRRLAKRLGVTSNTKVSDANATKLIRSEQSFRRLMAEQALSSLGVSKDDKNYRPKLASITKQIEAWGNKGNLVFLRLLVVASKANDISQTTLKRFAEAVKSLAGKKVTVFPGKVFPAVSMLLLTVSTFTLNFAAKNAQLTVTGKVRASASVLYGMGSVFRLIGYWAEYNAQREIAGVITRLRNSMWSTPAVAAFVQAHVDEVGLIPFTKAEIKLMTRNMRGSGSPDQMIKYRIKELESFNKFAVTAGSVVYKKTMGAFFAAADIAVGVQNIVEAADARKHGKSVAAAVLGVTGGFNIMAGACGLAALFVATPLAASLSVAVLGFSVLAMVGGIAAAYIDG